MTTVEKSGAAVFAPSKESGALIPCECPETCARHAAAAPVLGVRLYLTLSVRELEEMGAKPYDLKQLGAKPESATVRVMWTLEGARLAAIIPAFCRRAQDAGIFPRVLVPEGETVPDGPGAFAHGVFRGADLRGDFRGADFTGADLRRANMNGGTFTGACFAGARLVGADIRGASFAGCDAERADFLGVVAEHVDLTREWDAAELSGAIWSLAYPAPRGWTAHGVGHGRAVLLRADGAQ